MKRLLLLLTFILGCDNRDYHGVFTPTAADKESQQVIDDCGVTVDRDTKTVGMYIFFYKSHMKLLPDGFAVKAWYEDDERPSMTMKKEEQMLRDLGYEKNADGNWVGNPANSKFRKE